MNSPAIPAALSRWPRFDFTLPISIRPPGRSPKTSLRARSSIGSPIIGDPIELRALNDVFGDRPGGRIEIGSVKSNLGHLLSAAGMAGLFKVALALEHGTIPPTLFCETPNPRFDFDRSPLHPTTEPVGWPAGSERVAGVSSFGLGGTNAHLVLSGAPRGRSAGRRCPGRCSGAAGCGSTATARPGRHPRPGRTRASRSRRPCCGCNSSPPTDRKTGGSS
ncbi:ketoacyl-synthetase C-terminal extension domain-containing protein [Micromonospora sp. b486]|uniref:ketoacyl-synthetase C-terminal extension domain-containing protein n=1 Tax=Micromonospora sp. b486 TaxID=3053986 RepID=UPI00259C7B0B|nr:ketoacyl-synthetase C-terminal extension domain-containing protein [Micromonospora sp. b486]MDM4778131.1 ketoacyl-synthetase C-terminal extension domain-containing protein [Micromonospora sp. b486]